VKKSLFAGRRIHSRTEIAIMSKLHATPQSTTPAKSRELPVEQFIASHSPAAEDYPTKMSPVPIASSPAELNRSPDVRELTLYSHSTLVYWWPVWVVGYFMAALSYWNGRQYQIGSNSEWFHPSTNLGVLFLLTVVLVTIITNVSARGLVSGMILMGIALVTVLLAFFGLWDTVFAWFGNLRIHLNCGAYFWFSTLMFLVWAAFVFGVDRMRYWNFKPGQVTHEYIFGAGATSYDTNGMLLEKHSEDLFRHWLLGFGAGDLILRTSGASKETINIPNILFLGSKIDIMQRLIAEEPDS